MIPHNKTQDAINQAEQVASPLYGDQKSVTVTNKTLLALIAAAQAFLDSEEEHSGTHDD